MYRVAACSTMVSGMLSMPSSIWAITWSLALSSIIPSMSNTVMSETPGICGICCRMVSSRAAVVSLPLSKPAARSIGLPMIPDSSSISSSLSMTLSFNS